MDLSKQQKLDGDQKAIQQITINFTKNLRRVESATMLFIIEATKKSRFFKRKS